MFGTSRTRNESRERTSTLAFGPRLTASLVLCCLASVGVAAQSVSDRNTKAQTPAAQPHHHDHNAASPKAATTPAPATTPATAAIPSGPTESGAPAKRSGAVTIDTLQVVIPDLMVLDQHGNQRRFYSDLIKDKVVVLSFFYTSCVSICPAMSLALSKLQANLADRLGKDVFIITVTKDPETDTPAQLRSWGAGIGVKRGWTMVTGQTDVIAKIVKDFTGDRLGKDSHNTIFLIGSDKTGTWTDVSGYTTAQELRQQIDLVTKPAR